MKKHPAVTVAANTDPTKRGVTVAAAVSTVRGVERQRFIVSWPEGGKRHRKWFTTRDQADRFAEQARLDHTLEEQRQTILQRRVGEDDAGKLSAENLRDAVAALALLAGRGTLAEAAAALVRDIEARGRDVPTVAALVASYQGASEAAGLRPRSLGDLRVRLARFVEAFGPRKVNMVSSADARAWIEGLRTRDGKPLAPLSLQHFRFAVSGLFGYAIEHGHIEANPIAAVSHSRRARGSNRMESTAEILTPGEAKALLSAALEHAPAMVAPLALGLFAGVRTAELARMTWERHVNLAKGLVTITGDIAKKRSIRNVEMPAVLRSWLAVAPSQQGPVTPQGHRRLLVLARGKAGLARWPHNCLRHSFATYHLETYRDARATSLALGHRGGDDLLFEHYRTLTTPEAAAEYWKIEPPARAAAPGWSVVHAG